MREQPRPSDSLGSDWVEWCCPYCAAPLAGRGQALLCAREQRWFATQGGIHRLLSEDRRAELAPGIELRRTARRQGEVSAPQPGQDAVREEAAAHARRLLGVGRWRVLEAGATDCRTGLRLLREGHQVAAVGLDLNETDGLGAAGSLLASGEVLPRAEADLEALPLEPSFFDLVLVSGALHEEAHPGRALVELRRVTRRGGLLLVTGSPVFRRRRDGEALVVARMNEALRRTGRAVPREHQPGYFVRDELGELFRSSGWSLDVLGWPGRLREWVEDAPWGERHPWCPALLARRDG